jgi:hypothetical protein
MDQLKKNLWSIILVVLALITIMPIPGAELNNMFGYHSICAFTPYSTLILLVAGATVYFLKNRKEK